MTIKEIKKDITDGQQMLFTKSDVLQIIDEIESSSTAWQKLRSYVKDLSDYHEKEYAINNEFIDRILDKMNELEYH